MKAEAIKIEKFLSNVKTQFVIPVYQRDYDWAKPQCKQIFDDILKISRSNKNAHFIGSIVYICDDIYTSSNVNEFIIIDGQQRLTTLTLIYIVLYHLAIEMKDKERSLDIEETFLINKFASELEKKYKLQLTEHNDKAIKHILSTEVKEKFEGYSKVIANFDYFKTNITQENYRDILAGLSKLMFVEIRLERDKDDPQNIFESLNSTGMALSQADLIRNYILMCLEPNDQKTIYDSYWKIIEESAKDEIGDDSKVSDFIRDYLTLVDKQIPNKKDVYMRFKYKFPTTTIEDLKNNLGPMKSLVKFYNKIINPTKEEDKDIRKALEYINHLEINVSHPFLMKVYEDYSKGVIERNIFLEILYFIQSFIWRRFIVDIPTNALNKIFMGLYSSIDRKDYLASLQAYILKLKGKRRFPKDQEVREHLRLKNVYNITSKSKYFFEKLENWKNKEPVIIYNNEDITIEHIFPQTPSKAWEEDLGPEECNDIKETYLNTMANLTLVGSNSKLGNKPFIEKRDLAEGYKNSRLWLNKYLSGCNKWGKQELEGRFDLLCERFLQIWPYPNININDEDENPEVDIFDAGDPTDKKLEYVIILGQKILMNNVSELYQKTFQELFERKPEIFFNTDLGKNIGLTKEKNDLWRACKISDTYFIEGNTSSLIKFARIRQALEYFDLEDEVIIKYEN